MVYVGVPVELQDAVAHLLVYVKAAVARSTAASSAFFSIAPNRRIAPLPPAWLAEYEVILGSSLLCLETLPPGSVSYGLTTLTSFSLPCTSVGLFIAKIAPLREQYLLATVLAQLPEAAINVTEICDLNPSKSGSCTNYIGAAIDFVSLHPPSLGPATIATLKNLVAELNIEFVMFGQLNETAPAVAARIGVFNQPTFDFYAWLFVTDWVLGMREVVAFQGDAGNITVLLEWQNQLQQTPLEWQVLSNMAFYMRAGVLYITLVMLTVAATTAIYMVLSRGAFQWLNMLELCRVGGIVWVGRPLLLLRSMTALSVLSTAAVSLEYDGAISYFQEARAPWYTTVLAAGEVTWLVAVVNDVAMAVTQEYTGEYATINSILVWSTVALLSLVSPVTHMVSLAQTRTEKVLSTNMLVRPTGLPCTLRIGSRSKSYVYPSRLLAMAGVVYLIVSMVCTISYVRTLSDAFANDLWWEHYNTSGHEAFLVDVANHALALSGNGSLSLLNMTTTKAYASYRSSTRFYATYPRRLIQLELTTIEYAITNLRTLTTSWMLFMNTQHCWVDFNRTFEVAHTDARQARCAARYTMNAAVYVEATLRNTNWADFIIAFGGAGGYFTTAIQLALEESEAGRHWLNTTAAARAIMTVAAEAAYWRSFGLAHFQLQWQNIQQTGITETFSVSNAIGMEHVLTLKALDSKSGPQTTINLYWQPYNDWDLMAAFDTSMVRNATNWINSPTPADWEYMDLLTNASDGLSQPLLAFHNYVGPYVSIDLFLVPVPLSVVKLFNSFTALFEANGGAYATVHQAIAFPQPVAWSNYTFTGGNPACVGSPVGTSYVQRPFSFTDACVSTEPFAVNMTPEAVLFALRSSPASYDACLGQSAACHATLRSARMVLDYVAWPAAPVSTATAAVQALNVSFLQFATDVHNDWVVLEHSLLDSTDLAWSFFGWILLYDWVRGAREVVSFQGDVRSVVLISDAYAPVLYPTSGGDRYIEVATQYIAYLVAFSTAVRVGVAAVALLGVGAARCRVEGRNLFYFHRIVGSVWIGRPLSFLQGATAIMLMSTTQLTLTTVHGTTQLVPAPRSVLNTAIVAGEATWICYTLQEVLLVVIGADATRAYSHWSTWLTWLVYVGLERAFPVAFEGRFDRQCASVNMDYALLCTAGSARLGSPTRVIGLFIVPVIATVGGIITARGYRRWKVGPTVSIVRLPGLHLCAVSRALLVPPPDDTLPDRPSYLLAGILSWTYQSRVHYFDIKTWTFFDEPMPEASILWVGPVVRRLSTALWAGARPTVPSSLPTWKDRVRRLWAIGGLAYVATSIAASVTYLEISRVNLANDFYWAGFNSTGAHAFLATWINMHLLLNQTSGARLQLTAPGLNQPQAYNASTAAIPSALNYAARLQHTTFSTQLDEIVRGLRATDACDAPWIFTPYCYLDFQQTWPMANSAKRQQRCASMTTNGAVFLESLLRNVHADDWRACWGDAFQIAVADDLATSASGAQWLEATLTPQPVAVAIEVAHWQRHGIRSYDTQWQNYKQLGILNSYDIVSCYGAHYPFTLQSQNGSFRVQSQSSWKMYWSLANDLAAVATNGSGLAGLSLLRTSARYAFANQSLENIFESSRALVSPLAEGFQLIREVLGPFGSIDTVYISIPSVLRTAVAELSGQLKAALRTSTEAQIAFTGLVSIQWVAPVPLTWLDMYASTAGGSPLCPDTTAVSPLEMGLATFFSYSLPCNPIAPYIASLNPTKDEFVIATAIAQPQEASRVCALAPSNAGTCLRYLPPMQLFAATYLTPPPSTARDVTAALNIELMSYLRANTTSPVVLGRLRLLEEPDFELYSWLYLIDWVLGLREVVSFEGDVGTLTLLSELQKPLPQQIEAWQVATNVALYARSGILYITYVMIGVASVTSVYMVLSRGAFQWLNMLELCRVGGIVWVGRPLLLLRSMTALSVLSTAAVSLEYDGAISYFQEARAPWYTTVLAAGEVTWLVAVVNDVAMAVTQEYTGEYATINSILVWSTVALLSLVSPVTHMVSLAQTCHLEQVDFQMTCQSGTIVIGRQGRYVSLLAVVVASNLGCYLVARAVRPRPTSAVNSLFLSCGAKYLFEHADRTFNDVYFLDRASAVLTGLLSCKRHDRIYVFDIKLWRFFSMDLPPATPAIKSLLHGIPLSEDALNT
ncbi:hypothetical protein ACHHYP_13011 [Achlya hypogyna]|uniref:Uncharacterized protein n=1 Tax=Achlya hypogyna TaxID=1202772 RepID=A0A1V9YG84_ACHHY|nr:hypothetical protein ACHHYP_13011 [Achlya hypogyna]